MNMKIKHSFHFLIILFIIIWALVVDTSPSGDRKKQFRQLVVANYGTPTPWAGPCAEGPERIDPNPTPTTCSEAVGRYANRQTTSSLQPKP